MLIYPAIDIKNGLPVRLYKGDFNEVEQVGKDVVEVALQFKKHCNQLHLVDLDGAKIGSVVNDELICEAARRFDGFVQVGGGIRNMHSVKSYLDEGIDRVIVGTAALKDPMFLKTLTVNFGDKIAVSIDARDGFVATDGWLGSSTTGYIEFAKQCEQVGVGTLIFTDIAKDGTLSGPNIEQTKALRAAVGCTLIASGGIHSLDDLATLKSIGVDGAVCGKSLYHGNIELTEAVRIAENG